MDPDLHKPKKNSRLNSKLFKNNLRYLPGYCISRNILNGIITFVPGFKHYVIRGKDVINSAAPARYCYSVWLRHLVMAYENRLATDPDSIAELGPGQSIGIGLSALLSGASKYYALDVVKFASTRKNHEVFNGLVNLFKKRAAIPTNVEFPQLVPHLKSYEFPHYILTNDRLKRTLETERIASIESALRNRGKSDDEKIELSYEVSWNNQGVIKGNSVDIIISQAVLEHVENLSITYKDMYNWLKPGGFMSHTVDFRSHGLSQEWNGHWTYPNWVWKLMVGRSPYLLNRQPHSIHINLMKKLGLDIICSIVLNEDTKIKTKRLSAKFIGMSREDLTTKLSFVQAIRDGQSSRQMENKLNT